MLKKAFITIMVCAIVWVGTIYFGQAGMIYFPRGYATNSVLFKKVDKVSYRSGGDYQASFLFPNGSADKVPTTVWWLFGGNGATALDWIPMFDQANLPDGHVLILFDYPGYGKCHGRASPEKINQSVDTLFDELCARWELSEAGLAERSRCLGHSLGAAVAFDTAARYEMPEVVAISPFTSMKDMAKKKVGHLHVLLKHHFDNRKSVIKLVGQKTPPKIQIYHGSSDSLIPISMGRELSELAGPEYCLFRQVKGKGHNDILYSIRDELVKVVGRSAN